MSQSDFDITTADANTGLTFRAAVNAALQALVSMSSGATEPTVMYAYMYWADTGNALLKQRDAANTAWVTIGELGSRNMSIAGSLALTGPVGFSESGDEYLRLPRLTTAQRDALTPGSAFMIYNTTLSKFQFYIAAWHTLTADYLAATLTNKTYRQVKGVDAASATTLILSATGNYFDVTGGTTITSIATLGVGTVTKLHFDSVLVLTHHATNLTLPTNANITTKAGDEAEFVEYAVGQWRCTNYSRFNGRSLGQGLTVQSVRAQSAAVATGATAIPVDDTIPQNTEGTELTALNVAITPINANNILEIEVTTSMAVAANNRRVVGAIFQDSVANALEAKVMLPQDSLANRAQPCTLRFVMTAGTTSLTTFKFRFGAVDTTTVTVNGEAGARLFGGVMNSLMTVREIQA